VTAEFGLLLLKEAGSPHWRDWQDDDSLLDEMTFGEP
jgi:hypothetical protein